MPELPEVETTLQGISPHLLGQQIQQLTVHQHQLRWPVPPELPEWVRNQTIQHLTRRGKYLLLELHKGTLIIHLGMSGSLRVVAADAPRVKHEHIELQLKNGTLLRYHDPRRFGCWLWTTTPVVEHPLLRHLGPEPLSDTFSGHNLTTTLSTRIQAIKQTIMDSHVVVGVGNIYANEALFRSHIHPERPSHTLSMQECHCLRRNIRLVLRAAIRQGGTTLKDYVNSNGKPGYFAQKLLVYGRSGQPCLTCKTTLIDSRLGRRATVYCPHCQH